MVVRLAPRSMTIPYPASTVPASTTPATAAGTSLQALVKTTIFYANVEDFATINGIYARFTPDPPPARSAPANVALPRGLLISIDAIAVLPSA